MKNIAILATLDTKENEAHFIKGIIERRKHKAILIDAGIMGEIVPAGINRQRVAKAGGGDITVLRQGRDRHGAIEIMIKGACQVVSELYASKKLDGIISIGGSQGTAIGTAAMRMLPVGVPKIMVSTMASGDVRPYVGTKDITMMYSVVDVAGLNRILNPILANAAGAICGMVETETPQDNGNKPVIAISMFGVTTPCVMAAQKLLEEAGYEVVVFHATGTGGLAMEDLAESGFISGVLDVTTTELTDEIYGGVLSAGPNRLEAPGKKGIPHLVVPGALDMVNFGPQSTVPGKYRHRNLYVHNPAVTVMRTTKEENRQLGLLMAEKLNKAKGPVIVVIPLKGFSAFDKEGQQFFDLDADKAWIDSFKSKLDKHIPIYEIDAHINDQVFVEEIVALMIKLMKGE